MRIFAKGVGVNRLEALNILGLDDEASDADIKVAYKECVQILHPDRFANNKRLQDRATEQFKRLQDAYEYLSSDRGRKSSSSASPASHRRPSASNYAEAQLAGIAAARTQLVAQRDTLLDERRNAFVMIALGAVGALFGRRIIWIAGIAGTAIIWGIVKLIGAYQSIGTIDEHLKELEIQKRQIEEEWED